MASSVVALWIFVFWALGFFATFGAPGLARADEQSKILTELHAQKLERLEVAILQAQRDYCQAEQDSKPRDFYLEQRNKKLNEYYAVTKAAYQGLPACDEI